ncbi:MAG: MoaD/ThiS family protein [Chitinophagaceae bacterium]|nr:MoaD/ThiS family protein [Chitinophagaceae bacterium]MDP1763209.1 MoaD/ThiS family protein [Sediminibacterium sp.]MDP1810312.1 MoaD/ThiS family protein [Sediminibacterium sp.]MDP3128484.1 MoaD/ThiS family protein [Sediminibacterium sp.]MDP3665186.1 MoaD/ThiS family protein [Sediminibacterium sp.]
MRIHVLFFGSLTDATVVPDIYLETVADTAALKELLIQQYPLLRTAKYFIAVNQKMVQENTTLKTGDTVALMPPFSGG